MATRAGRSTREVARLADWVCSCCGEAQRGTWKAYHCDTCGDAICSDCVPGVMVAGGGLFCGRQCFDMWKVRDEGTADD